MKAIDAYIEQVYQHNVFRLGTFTLKSGVSSPIYIDFRGLISEPELLATTADFVCEVITSSTFKYDYIVGVPFAALPLGTLVSYKLKQPMLMKRPTAKAHGTKKLIEGIFEAGKKALIIEDVVTTGASIKETVLALRDEGLVVEDVVAVLDREQGGAEALKQIGITLHSVLKVSTILSFLQANGTITSEKLASIKYDLANPRPANGTTPKSWTLESRREALFKNPLNKKLVEIIQQKKTNLCVSMDVETAAEALEKIKKIKDYVCAVKLHFDAYIYREPNAVNILKEIREIANSSDFVLFEDRKFADIGSTHCLQLGSGSDGGLASLVDLVTAHINAGVESIQAFGSIINSKEATLNGVLLVAEMSSKGAITDGDYQAKAVLMAKQCQNVVSGFICQKRCSDDGEFLYWSPGVNLEQKSDGKGQQWRTVEDAVVRDGNDIIIVGRGIIKASNVEEAAKQYATAGWECLQRRT